MRIRLKSDNRDVALGCSLGSLEIASGKGPGVVLGMGIESRICQRLSVGGHETFRRRMEEQRGDGLRKHAFLAREMANDGFADPTAFGSWRELRSLYGVP